MADCDSYRPRARVEGLHVQELGDELLIFDSNDDHAHSLNETAARVWRACDGSRDLDALEQACAVDRGSLELALELLRERGLLEEPSPPVTFSRRKLLGAAVALPVVVSAVAPTAAMASSSGTAVALCYADVLSYAQDVQSKLMGTGRFSSVTLIDCTSTTPSVATLQGYRAVLTWGDDDYADPTTLGNNLATYAGGGNTVVVATFALGADGEDYDIAGGIVALLPFVQGIDEGYAADLTLVADVPGSPLLAGVSSFDGGSASYRDDVTLASGATQVAHWSSGLPLVAYKGNVVGLNFWPPSSDAYPDAWLSSTNGAALMANALLF